MKGIFAVWPTVTLITNPASTQFGELSMHKRQREGI